jgi:outer membrane protein
MKNSSWILNIILLIAVGVLYFLHFSGTKSGKAGTKGKDSSGTAASNGFKVAYFTMDSLENNYDYYKDAKQQVKNKEESVRAEMERAKRSYQDRAMQLNKRAPTMTQSEGEAATVELQQLQGKIQQLEEQLRQELLGLTETLRRNINKNIEEFLKDYNKERGYSYIILDQVDLVYYKDTTYNITNDLIKGLNEGYKLKNKK